MLAWDVHPYAISRAATESLFLIEGWEACPGLRHDVDGRVPLIRIAAGPVSGAVSWGGQWGGQLGRESGSRGRWKSSS